MKKSHYRILKLIGEGQFGRVFCGIHRQTGELFALKELNPQKLSTKKFLREIRILLSLNHPNIVSCQGVEHNDNGRYLVTEYCEGGTLRDLLELKAELNLAHKLQLIIDILRGLIHAHNHGIIHRDLKPENILLNIISNGWRAKITDFGVAKIEQEDKKNYGLGDTGSPGYMAPEQFYGKYSYSSDIYSMGIILYELLVGERPFSGNPNEIMIAHLNKLPLIPDEIPLSLRSILNKALQKLHQHRFLTAKEMLNAVENAVLSFNLQKTFIFNKIKIEDNKKLELTKLATYKVNKCPDKLKVFNNKIYQIIQKEITRYVYNIENNLVSIIDELSYQFEDEIIDIQLFNDEYIVVTEKKVDFNNEYSFYQSSFNSQHNKFLLIKAESLIYTIDEHQKWLALAKQSKSEIGFKIIKLPKTNTLKPFIEVILPSQLITIDKHHGLAIFSQYESGNYSTLLRFFTRRGNWGDIFSISLPLSLVTPNLKNPNYFVAIEQDYENKQYLGMILISIKPFKVTRIPLNIKPNFILSHGLDFLIADQKGNIILLNVQGEIIGEMQLNNQKITAIATLSDNKIILASKSGKEGNLDIYTYTKPIEN